MGDSGAHGVAHTGWAPPLNLTNFLGLGLIGPFFFISALDWGLPPKVFLG